MQAVKLCTNKILQFLTGGVGLHRLTCIMAINGGLLVALTLQTLLTGKDPSISIRKDWQDTVNLCGYRSLGF